MHTSINAEYKDVTNCDRRFVVLCEEINAIVYWDRGPARRQRGTSEDFISGTTLEGREKGLSQAPLFFSCFLSESSRRYCRFAWDQLPINADRIAVDFRHELTSSIPRIFFLTCEELCCNNDDNLRDFSFFPIFLIILHYASYIKKLLNFIWKEMGRKFHWFPIANWNKKT